MAGTAQSESDGEAAGGGYGRLCLLLLLGGLYVACSACLIAFNKYLMHPGRFPYAVVLVMIHCGFCSVSMLILWLCFPSLFPSLTDPARRVTVDRELVLRGALPIALLFSGQMVLSNTAYLHSSVAFLQMMKEGNLIIVFVLSLVLGLERLQWRSCCVLGVVMFATVLTIHGEMNFSLTGFCIQGFAQVLECVKIVLQALLLTAAGRKLDAFTYLTLVMPLAFAFLSVFFGVLMYVQPHSHLHTPEWSVVEAWWPILGVNACVALALNVVVAFFVKNSSAVSFILAGIVKDAMIVLAGTAFFREIVSSLQVFGFALQLSAILIWSLMKAQPQRFEAGVARGLLELIGGQGEKDFGHKKGGTADYGAASC